MPDLEKVIERIQHTTAERNLSVNMLLTENGAGKDMLANMKKGQMPSMEKFCLVADYLSCSLDYLLLRKEKPEINV